MNYNDKKNTEHDDMNIKTHLNTSLELDGISVSEDLINRTLQAIKQQQAPQEMEERPISSDKKVITWNKYVRGLAGIAAAIVVVVVGYSIINNMGMQFSKSSDKASDSQEFNLSEAKMDIASKEDADGSFKMEDEAVAKDENMAENSTSATVESTEDSVGQAQDVKENDEEATLQFRITADTASPAENSGTGTNDSYGTEAQSEAGRIAMDQDKNAEATGDESQSKLTSISGGNEETVILTFRDIFLSEPNLAEYITITDEVNNTSITLTEQKDIQDFYSVMDQHQFTYDVNSSSTQNYTVEVKTPQPEDSLYTMVIGESISVNYTSGDVVSSGIFHAVDSALLKQSLDEFIQKYK